MFFDMLSHELFNSFSTKPYNWTKCISTKPADRYSHFIPRHHRRLRTMEYTQVFAFLARKFQQYATCQYIRIMIAKFAYHICYVCMNIYIYTCKQLETLTIKLYDALSVNIMRVLFSKCTYHKEPLQFAHQYHVINCVVIMNKSGWWLVAITESWWGNKTIVT